MTMAKPRIMILGFGMVGQGFYELFNQKRHSLGLGNVSISEIVDAKFGHIIEPCENIISEVKGGKTFPKIDPVKAISESDSDIVCEFTWLDLKTGEPAYSHIKTALGHGKHVITTNKGPSALKFRELNELAKKNNIQFKMKGTVMAGTPSFNLLELLPGIEVKSVRGIMNGTTNYILERMVGGKDFNESLREAQSLGYAEADPTNDVDGFDTGAKIVIISNILGWNHDFNKMNIEGIRKVTREQAANGTKLVAYADRNHAFVKPVELPRGDILREVNGVMNAVEFETDTLGKIYSMGPGAGRIETAQSALTDLVSILKNWGN